ncbi:MULTISPECIES: type I restriction endonuclease subunit R [unclassified Agrobacterium]|uniref:type I restriction endonuclease subunit R n=1 Tax=unclassified Agrobacterium TaxID=2632611 RepID=UPI00244BBF8F|nr:MULTISPECIES: type I restriction endonuclease subunit R [unclassified Agrobacterium]MDH0611949.1 type I restriction endonuclease subunit R [Agrobacterium sp. GD03872]MDH0695846.1 type I restriction endonuclease subunit R [Agrobacterium sp. GD03871]MDH1058880.1 type I restriction endonuclease subunit R [Agrobacterium sp. GD03992]MDH2210971.1 type I restriction endonuclease subunit R [Agrobacterium sp. GD03643]MDH2217612.1 type I restriction endonuclease subunit R [Agrobacterium sp. GD03638]
MNNFTEDRLVQQTMADYLEAKHGWRVVMAWNKEVFGPEGTLGRKSDKDVVLTRYLSEALLRMNPGLPEDAYVQALREITDVFSSQSLLHINQEKYALVRDGVRVKFRQNGEQRTERLRVFDFDNAENNDFLAVRELWVQGYSHRRRADIVGFVNGLPLMFCELKRPDKDLKRAYAENLSDYKDAIPHLFHFNAFVILGNGDLAKLGSISADYDHFSDWLKLDEAEQRDQMLPMEALLRVACDKRRFMDLFENFILFADTANGPVKILAKNHQFLGVNRAVEAVANRHALKGKLGVFWHTQGSGKSFSMALFTQKVHRKLGGDYTFLVLTDRTDLDNQIYKTFASVGFANNDKDPCRAGSAQELRDLLGQQKKVIFGMIQKFTDDQADAGVYSDRDNIIVMTDEAHRSQYGTLALNMRKALPNAAFIGFTGTPLFSNDQITKQVFGAYLSTYDFQDAIEDGATLPLYYDARGDKLQLTGGNLNEKLAAAIADAEIDDPDVAAKLSDDLKREYHVVTAEPRLRHIARDFAWHFSSNWESGKAMFVAIDKITAVRMYDFISDAWQSRLKELEKDLANLTDDQERVIRSQQIAWMRQTEMAVVVSDEQNEIKKFKNWGLDIIPHRKRMKDGFTVKEVVGGREIEKRLDLETAFKREDHPLRIVIVCAMWLTGFDVPSLSTLYLDKPLQAHTLMQAIARANRVKEGKNNGLIVDYCGILKNLRKALATFAGHTGGKGPLGEGGDEPVVDPLNPQEALLGELAEAIHIVRQGLHADGFELDRLHEATGFHKLKALKDAKELINENDETRKRFEIAARAVFRKYKSCLTFPEVQRHKPDFQAINYIYASLQEDKLAADTSAIIQKLNAIVGEAIDIRPDSADDKIFDISKVNFELLRREFAKSERKASDVQDLRTVLEERLAKMLAANPTLQNFQERFDQIIAGYNHEKDKNTIEATFEALMRMGAELEGEALSHVALGLTQEQKPVFDLLMREDLTKEEIRQIKAVSVEVLKAIQRRMEEVQDLFEKQSTRDDLRQQIYDLLYDDRTGLPAAKYDEGDLDEKTDVLFQHFMHSFRPSGYGGIVGVN